MAFGKPKKEKVLKTVGTKDTKEMKKGEVRDTSAIDAAIRDIKTKFGDEALMTLGNTPRVDVDAVPSGSIGLDWALGIGGYPRGRILEIYGPESSGKTTLCLHAIAEAQKKGGICAFIDAEHALDPEYAKKIGVKLDELLVSQPDTGEQALEIVEGLVRSGKIDIVVIDGARNSIANTLDGQIATAKQKVATTPKPGIVAGASTANTMTDAQLQNPATGAWYWVYTIYLWILLAVRWLVGKAGVFYPVLAIAFLYLIYRMYRRFRRPAWQR